MKRFKKLMAYSFGAFLAFIFSHLEVLAQSTSSGNALLWEGRSWDGLDNTSLYGVGYESRLTFWQKIISFFSSPVVIAVAGILIIGAAIIVYSKRKPKDNVKKDT